MPTPVIFGIHLLLGYAPWLLVLATYGAPRLGTVDAMQAQRAIALLHSFRFFGLVFVVPGVVSPDLPASFATSAAYGDFATGVLAMLALVSVRVRPLFWVFVIAFNVVGTGDLLLNYYHGAQIGLPQRAGELAAIYWIPVLYVPALMITHVLAFYLLLRRRPTLVQDAAGAGAS